MQMPLVLADPVLAPDALREHRAGVILLDARSAEAFAASRAAGARRLPIELWEAAAKTEQGRRANADHWAQAIGALGWTGRSPSSCSMTGG
jgi:thiosulfate/3-mercaptopyruvate sulfurtransferase